MDSREIEAAILRRDLIGVNLHRDDEGNWSCWTRKRGENTGWSRSGSFPTLSAAVSDAFDEADNDRDIEDLL